MNEGKCWLCGEIKELTFEHYPPRNAYNNSPAKRYTMEETKKILAGENTDHLDFENSKGRISQRGRGEFCLCKNCNNNTGDRYMKEYGSFAKKVYTKIYEEEHLEINNPCSITIEEQYPLRIFKAIMTMFGDLNRNDGSFKDEKFLKFIREKESIDIDLKKYQVYMYFIAPSEEWKYLSLSPMFLAAGKAMFFTFSEIASSPIGLLLYINKPEQFQPNGVLINSFAKYQYNEQIDINLDKVPYREIDLSANGFF